MTVTPRRRALQRAETEAALRDAAWARLARMGPDGTSVRDVASDAGCNHALVARYFGSKRGLVDAVAARLAACVAATVDGIDPGTPEALAGLLAVARDHRDGVQLLVRCGLGDLAPAGFPEFLGLDRILAATRARADEQGLRGDRRARMLAYAGSCLLLGWLTFDDFLIAATRLGRVGTVRRDVAMAGATAWLIDLAATPEPALAARDLSYLDTAGPAAEVGATGAKEALLRAAIERFAESGPASVSVRDVGRHAGVNQGLIYRHFGSKQALLTEAIEVGSAGLFPAARSSAGFDYDAMSHLLHHRSAAPRLIARTLVDGVDITDVRQRFPVLRSLLEQTERLPGATTAVDLTDPRVAVAAAAGMALGSVIWGEHVRPAVGLSDHDGHEAMVADLARALVSAPNEAVGGRELQR